MLGHKVSIILATELQSSLIGFLILIILMFWNHNHKLFGIIRALLLRLPMFFWSLSHLIASEEINTIISVKLIKTVQFILKS